MWLQLHLSIPLRLNFIGQMDAIPYFWLLTLIDYDYNTIFMVIDLTWFFFTGQITAITSFWILTLLDYSTWVKWIQYYLSGHWLYLIILIGKNDYNKIYLVIDHTWLFYMGQITRILYFWSLTWLFYTCNIVRTEVFYGESEFIKEMQRVDSDPGSNQGPSVYQYQSDVLTTRPPELVD